MFRRYRYPRPKKRWGFFKRFTLFVIVAASFGAFWFIRAFDRHLLPTAVEISETRAQALIGEIINGIVKDAAGGGLSSSDFYTMTIGDDGSVSSFTVDSVLVSSLCAQFAEELSSRLSSLPEEWVELPTGVLTGIKSLATSGPAYRVKLRPIGAAEVNYQSSFTSAGINQTNFQIWVQANARLRIVNPIQDAYVIADRKILLVDTVINGPVPRGIPLISGQ